MIQIPHISPIRFFKKGANDRENGAFELYSDQEYKQSFKGVAETVVYASGEITDWNFNRWVEEDEQCYNISENYVIDLGILNPLERVVFDVKTDANENVIVLRRKHTLELIDAFLFQSLTYETIELNIPDLDEYELVFGVATELCHRNIKIEIGNLLPLNYSICGEEYQAEYLGQTPYTDNDSNPLFAYKLSTLQHGTYEGVYVMEIGDYQSEPIEIDNTSELRKITYKTNGWKYCAFKNYTYVLWLDYRIIAIPKNDTANQDNNDRNIVLEGFPQLARAFNVREVIPDYLAEILEFAFNFDNVTLENNEYTKIEEAEYENANQAGFMQNFNIEVRKPYECQDLGEYEFTCEPARVVVIDQDGNEFADVSVGSGQTEIVEISTGCPPCPQDLTLIIPFKLDDDEAEITVVADSEGTITSINDGGLDNLEIEKNGTPVSLPFTVSENDDLLFTFDSATSDGVIKLEGDYV